MSLQFVADPTKLPVEDGYRLTPDRSSMYGCMRCQNRDHGMCHGCNCPCSDQQFGLSDGEVHTPEQKAIIEAVGWRSWDKDPVKSKRGRTSLRAGKDAERAIAKAYQGTRTGQYGGADDVTVGDLLVVQSKAGGWFSNRYWAELQKLPRVNGRVPMLVVSDRPGPGHRTRRMVVMELGDHVSLLGRDGLKDVA